MKKLFIVALFSFMIASCQEKRERIKREGEPDITLVNSDDEEMNSAIENARLTFEKEFRTALLSKNTNFSNFFIKQRYALPNNDGEHIWVGDIEFKDGIYSGIINNEPNRSIGVKFGDTVIINVDNLSDWMYYDKNIVKGAYTVKVLRKTMTAEEKKEMDSQGLIYE